MDKSNQKEFLKAKVTCSSDSEELVKLAKKQGIVLPSDHLGAFKTIYAQADGRANRNGVRLSREAVEKSLPSLKGAQVNINHWRQNWTVGSIFWAKLNKKDEIEIAFTFFKDIYEKEFDIATALFEDGELTVSFELNSNPDTIEFNEDGTRTLNDINFVGVGLLLDEKPAEPTAIVFEMAKRRVMELIRNDTSSLVYAKEAVVNCQDLLVTINKALEEKEKSTPTLDLSKGTNKNKEVSDTNLYEDLEEGGNQMKKKEDKKVEEKAKETVEEKDKSKVDEKVEESTEEKAEESTEEKVDEKAEESTEEKVEEKADLEVVTKVDRTIVETMDEKSDTVEVESEVTRTVKRDGEVVSEETSETTEKTTFTFAEVEKIKAEYEATIEALKASLEGKDGEIEVAKEKAIKVEKLRAELGEYVKDFSDEDFDNEDKLDNARLRKENDKLKADSEIKDKASEDVIEEEKVVEKVETASLETGHKESTVSQGSPLVSYLKDKKLKK